MAGTRDTTHVVGLAEEGGEGALLEHGGFSSFFAQRASERRGKFLEGFLFFFFAGWGGWTGGAQQLLRKDMNF